MLPSEVGLGVLPGRAQCSLDTTACPMVPHAAKCPSWGIMGPTGVANRIAA